jgi:hypothetical protein
LDIKKGFSRWGKTLSKWKGGFSKWGGMFAKSDQGRGDAGLYTAPLFVRDSFFIEMRFRLLVLVFEQEPVLDAGLDKGVDRRVEAALRDMLFEGFAEGGPAVCPRRRGVGGGGWGRFIFEESEEEAG